VSCPEALLLSQLVDGELADADAATVRRHLATCAACTDRMAHLGAATSTVRSPLPAPPGVPSAGCLAPEQVAGWVRRALPDAELRVVDAHLDACDACLAEVRAADRMMALLETGPSTAVPDTLKARVASRWVDAKEPSLTEIVVRVARAGLALLERHLVAPVLAVDELLAPMPAMRSTDAADAVRFRISAPGAHIQAAIVPAGDAIALTLTLRGDADEALPGQRVFVRRHGRSVFSARTDGDGELRVQRIEPGIYEIACPGIGTSFRLDLRP
jgi:anti-sigma factor RsiW